MCLGRIQAGQQFFIRLIGIDQNILDEFQKVDSQSLGVDAGGIHVAQLADNFRDFLIVDLHIEIDFFFHGGQTEDVFHIFQFQFTWIVRQTLFQKGEGISHATFCHSCQFGCCLLVVRDAFFFQNFHESFFDLIRRDLGEVVALAS